MLKHRKLLKSKFFNKGSIFLLGTLLIYTINAHAADTTTLPGPVNDLLSGGQSVIKVAAKWGGILTVVGGALALGSGRLEGALAQTVCKVIVVIGILSIAVSYFGGLITYGFAF